MRGARLVGVNIRLIAPGNTSRLGGRCNGNGYRTKTDSNRAGWFITVSSSFCGLDLLQILVDRDVLLD
jgi:hypothetical protein